LIIFNSRQKITDSRTDNNKKQGRYEVLPCRWNLTWMMQLAGTEKSSSAKSRERRAKPGQEMLDGSQGITS